MNILIGVPAPEYFSPEFTHNLLEIVAYTHKNTEHKCSFAYQKGVRTDRNRNQILQRSQGQDAILWLDCDMLFPADIIEKYVKADKDIIGCLYYKRNPPHQPVGYKYSGNPLRPYRPLNPRQLPENTVIGVDGLGYGGLFVKMSVYEKLGDLKWTKYGKNFHIPEELPDSLTHDLQFCEDCKKSNLSLYLHTGVKPSHVAAYEVTEADYLRLNEPKVTVVIPATDMEAAARAGKLMKERAGYPCEVVIAEDIDRTGLVKTVNAAIRNHPSDYYVYAAQDVFAGFNWLKIGMDKLTSEKKGLLAFNSSRWGDRLASFGLIEHRYMTSIYNGDLFCKDYKSHFCDVELSLIAKSDEMFVYEPKAVIVELDERMVKPADENDQVTFFNRQKTGFDGRIASKFLLHRFVQNDR